MKEDLRRGPRIPVRLDRGSGGPRHAGVRGRRTARPGPAARGAAPRTAKEARKLSPSAAAGRPPRSTTPIGDVGVGERLLLEEREQPRQRSAEPVRLVEELPGDPDPGRKSGSRAIARGRRRTRSRSPSRNSGDFGVIEGGQVHSGGFEPLDTFPDCREKPLDFFRMRGPDGTPSGTGGARAAG